MSTTSEPARPEPDTHIVTYGDKEYEVLKEGLAEILNPKDDSQAGNTAKGQAVFYNPIQQFNRDLSVLAIRAFGEDLAAIRKSRAGKKLKPDTNRGRKRKRVPEGGPGTIDAQEAVAENSAEAGIAEADPPTVGGHTCGAATVSRDGDGNGNGLGTAPKAPKADLDRESGQTQKPTFRILDALSATGLRALRYAKEVPMASSVTANDLSSAATASIELNVRHNGVGDIVNPTTSDARVHMYNSASLLPQADQRLYQVIDLDPYGTVAPFLDAAVQALTNGGLLCVTCTDAGVFASHGFLEKTYSQYGGLPFKGPQSHEGGLRLILHAIATSAARYGIAIEPLLSLSIDFYVRLFVRIKKSPAEVKLLAGKTMIVYNCDAGCGSWTTQFLAQTKEGKNKNGDPLYKFSLAQAPSAGPHCEHCGFKTHLSGPMWGGPLHNPFYVQKILDLLPSLDKETYRTIPRIEGMLTLARDEAILPDESTTQSKTADAEAASPDDFPATEPAGEILTTAQTPEPFPSLPAPTRIHHPFFLIPSVLARVIHCTSPSDAAMRGALMHLGYRTTGSHTKPGSIVTDAPWRIIWEIMREYARQKAPIKEGSIKPGTAGWAIMAKSRVHRELDAVKADLTKVINGKASSVEELKTELEAVLYRLQNPDAAKSQVGKAGDDSSDLSTLTINFDEELGKERAGKKLVRYQQNPRPDWGPMSKASG